MMSIKMEDVSRNIQSTRTPPASAKISIFTNKTGFVIPKNKLSGSLVPVFRGGKKDGNESVNEDVSKHVRRKTKWGPDLTQDTTVRKGRALAYQIRVDQITQQMSSGPMDWHENQDMLSVSTNEDYELNNENIKVLELEKREAIGEILKLNPNYKPPAGYKPIQKEAKIPIPIKEHPGYNFTGLIFGPVSDTHKRLEKETGAKVKVYGIKEDTGQKVEVTSADEDETCSTYKEMYVQVLADTYDKVDTAASLIKLLVTPVSVKPNPASVTISSNDMAVTDNPGVVQQPIEGPGPAPSHGHFQQRPWFPGTAVAGNSIHEASLGNPSLSGPHSMVARFGPVPQSHSLTFIRPNMPLASQQPQPPLPPLQQTGAPRNSLTAASESTPLHRSMIVPPQMSVSQPMSTGIPQAFRPGSHSGWSPWNSPAVSSTMGFSVLPPVGFPRGNLSGSASAGIAINQQPANSLLQSQMQPPLPPQSLIPNSVTGRPLNFDTMNSFSRGAPRPQQPGSSDFIFQPHRSTSVPQVIPRPDGHFDPPTNMVKNQFIQSGHAPQSPSIRPEIHNPNLMQVNNRTTQWQPTPVSFARLTAGPPPPIRPMAFPNSGVPPPSFAQMHPRNFNPVAMPLVNSGSYPPRTGNLMFQQNSPAMVAHPPNFPTPNNEFRPGKPASSGTFGMQQTYDPFSPTSLS